MNCTHCNSEVVNPNENRRYRYRKTGRIFCSTACGMERREIEMAEKGSRRGPNTPVPGPQYCHECRVLVELDLATLRRYALLGRAFCSKTCSGKYRSRRSSETMSRTNLQHASARMRANNPMKSKDSREKMRATILAMGHQPKVRGGNGREPTKAETMLHILLSGIGFEMQHPIRTRMPRGSGYPTTYKPDAANQTLMIAIEADGASHCGHRLVLDAKKDKFLSGLGWTVLRFSNARILNQPASVLETVMSTISRLKGSTLT